jgi:hypothetical protein
MKNERLSRRRFVLTWWFQALPYALIALLVCLKPHLSLLERILLVVAGFGLLRPILAMGFQAYAKRHTLRNESHHKPLT